MGVVPPEGAISWLPIVSTLSSQLRVVKVYPNFDFCSIFALYCEQVLKTKYMF